MIVSNASDTGKDGYQKRKKTYPEPSGAVLGLDLVDIAEPVAVPAPKGGRVVHADGVNANCQC